MHIKTKYESTEAEVAKWTLFCISKGTNLAMVTPKKKSCHAHPQYHQRPKKGSISKLLQFIQAERQMRAGLE